MMDISRRDQHAAPRRPRNKLRRACLLLVGAASLAVVASVIYYLTYSAHIGFDSSRWKIAAGSELRQAMVRDLTERHELEGLDQQQVIELLGPPDRRDRFDGKDYSYDMGTEDGFMSIDSIWLTLYFKDEQVVAVQVTRD